MLSWLEGQQTGLIDFACQLISTPSPNPPGDEQAVVAVTQAKLRELGIADSEVVGCSPNRPNLIASVPGTGRGPAPDIVRAPGHKATR